MFHRVIFSGVLLAATVNWLSGAIDPKEWKHRQTFELSTTGLVKISLPAETLDLARADLEDLRLAGPAGEEIPYAVERVRPPTPARQSPKSFRLRLQNRTTEIVVETGTNSPLESIELVTPTGDFLKAARLELSPDGEHWTPAADGLPLVRQLGIDAVSLPLHQATAAFLRVTIDDARTSVVPFTSARLTLASAKTLATIPVSTQLEKREEFVRETVLTFDLKARQLPLAALEFTSPDAFFSRPVTITRRELKDGESIDQVLARGTIFRSQLPAAAPRESLRIALDFTTDARELQVHLANGDNAPLALGPLTVSRRPVFIAFRVTQPGSFALLTGHAQAAKPIYDLANFSSDLRGLPETTVAIGQALPNSGYQKPDGLIEAPLLGSALDVADWKFRKAVTVAAPGAQELELDLEVLAHANRNLSDLRLMYDGRQVPYLLEHTSSLRPISLYPVRVDDPKSPRLSRWKFELPRAGVPLRRFNLTSTTPLFSRQVHLFELGTDNRGENFQRPLCDTTGWSSTPERPNPNFAVELWAIPQTKELYVEIDNGDNPPISLGAAHADYAVTRLLFRFGDEPEPLDLHYGAPASEAPHYDLELVARQLLREEKSPATLGPETSADSSAGDHTFFSGLHGGVVLWSALGLVVIVLLAVIARLLPKFPPAAS